MVMEQERKLTKQERANLIYPLMMVLDMKANLLYWLPDSELLELADTYL